MRRTPHRLNRRDFLGLAGMAAVLGGISCIGGVSGYLLLDRVRPKPAATSAPGASADRPARLKQIDRPVIVTRVEWGAREPDHAAASEPGFYSLENAEGWRTYEGDLRITYRTLVVHHSAYYDTDDLTTIKGIQDQHMDLRGWADIAYHFGVGRSGAVFEGRALDVRGTHVENYNSGSVGVVFFGDFDVELPAAPQIESGRRLIDWLALRLGLTHLAGHRDFNDETDCPGTAMLPYLALFAQSAGLTPGTGGYQPSPEQLLTLTPDAP